MTRVSQQKRAVKAVAALAWAVLRRPSLWVTAAAQVWRMAPQRWWRRPPFLPLPDADYVRFRLHTMYGDDRLVPEAEDVVSYLQWCRTFPRRNGGLATAAGK